MTPATWTAVDDYLCGLMLSPDPVLDATQRSAADAGLPPISVSAAQGKFLHLLTRIAGARRVLEIGTLAGYSTIWLGRALPKDGAGRLVTLEFDPAHAEIARANIARAGLDKIVEVRVGAAIDTLPSLSTEAPFDLIFIDADKPSTPDYFRWAVKLSHPGSVIVVDNVVRGGDVIDTSGKNQDAEGMRRFFDLLAAEPRATGTAIQTVGAKGYDGFAIVVVT
jgi:predicted O-methyltransferase YrrM